MRIFISLLIIGMLFTSCDSDDDIQNPEPQIPLTQSLVERGIKYGSEERQFLDLYKAASDCPTPIYFDAHGNGGNTTIPTSLVEDLNAQGITIIAWESLTAVNTPTEVEVGWNDAQLMFQWVIDHAETYKSLGIGEKATLVHMHSIGETSNTNKYQFLVDFALSVIETCP